MGKIHDLLAVSKWRRGTVVRAATRSGCKIAREVQIQRGFAFNLYSFIWKNKLYKADQKFVSISRSLRNTDSCPVYVQSWHQFFHVIVLSPISLISRNRVFLPLTLHSPHLAWQRGPCGTALSHRDTAETGRAPGYFPNSASEKCHTSTKYCWCGFRKAQAAQQGEQGSGWPEEECRGGRNPGSLTLCIRLNTTPWLRAGSCPHHNQLSVSLSIPVSLSQLGIP